MGRRHCGHGNKLDITAAAILDYPMAANLDDRNYNILDVLLMTNLLQMYHPCENV